MQNLLLGLVLLGGLGTLAGSLDSKPYSPPKPTDPPAASACRDFNHAVDDVHTDLRTNSQLQKVFDQGRRAETPLARETFYELQRARLSGDPVAFKKAAAKMMTLCHTAAVVRN
jgi:hypothetical protein